MSQFFNEEYNLKLFNITDTFSTGLGCGSGKFNSKAHKPIISTNKESSMYSGELS
jgi:hypothetical protein